MKSFRNAMMPGLLMFQTAFLAATTFLVTAALPAPKSTPPTVTLANGVEMPMIAAGCYQYNSSEAEQSIGAALDVGFTMIDTALDYWNQDGVGRAIHTAIAQGKITRDELFVETKVPGCGNPLENTTHNPFDCYKTTQKNLELNLQQLNLSYVDLVIIHFPPFPSFIARSCNNITGSCEMARQQWKAMMEFYKSKKARAIGISNYCPSCMECLKDEEVFPMVNQVMYHLGSSMNAAATSLISYDKAHKVVTQGYSALGNTPWGHHASADILHGNLTTAIAKAHNKSTVEVALKYVVSQGIPAITKSSNPAHLGSDLDLWSWDLTQEELTLLKSHKSPDSPTYPSFACSK